MEVLEFFFGNFWHFLGLCIVLLIIFKFIKIDDDGE